MAAKPGISLDPDCYLIWNTPEEIENARVLFIYNYKGKMVFFYIHGTECQFSVFKDGVLYAPFQANAK